MTVESSLRLSQTATDQIVVPAPMLKPIAPTIQTASTFRIAWTAVQIATPRYDVMYRRQAWNQSVPSAPITWISAGSDTGSSFSGTAAGATLTRSHVHARQLTLIATRCSTCGRIEISWNGKTIARTNLASSTTQYAQRITLPIFSTAQTGPLTIRVITSGRPVSVDGIAVTT